MGLATNLVFLFLFFLSPFSSSPRSMCVAQPLFRGARFSPRCALLRVVAAQEWLSSWQESSVDILRRRLLFSSFCLCFSFSSLFFFQGSQNGNVSRQLFPFSFLLVSFFFLSTFSVCSATTFSWRQSFSAMWLCGVFDCLCHAGIARSLLDAWDLLWKLCGPFFR